MWLILYQRPPWESFPFLHLSPAAVLPPVCAISSKVTVVTDSDSPESTETVLPWGWEAPWSEHMLVPTRLRFQPFWSIYVLRQAAQSSNGKLQAAGRYLCYAFPRGTFRTCDTVSHWLIKIQVLWCCQERIKRTSSAIGAEGSPAEQEPDTSAEQHCALSPFLRITAWPTLRGLGRHHFLKYKSVPPSQRLQRLYIIGDWILVTGEGTLIGKDEGECGRDKNMISIMSLVRKPLRGLLL